MTDLTEVRRKIRECHGSRNNIGFEHGFTVKIQNQAPGDPDQASDWFCYRFWQNERRAEIIVR